jgi:phage-related protein
VKLIEGAAPKIIGILPGLVEKILPSLVSSATSMVNSFVSVLPSLIGTISTTLANETDSLVQSFLDLGLTLGEAIAENAPVIIGAFSQILESAISWIGEYSSVFGEVSLKIIDALVTGILSNLPSLVESALITIEYFADGIVTSLPTLIPAIMDVIMQIVHILTDPSNLTSLLNAALVIITELAYGLMDAIPQLVQAVSDIIINIADFLVDPVNLANILKAAVDVVIALAIGLVDAIPVLLKHLPKLWLSIIDNFRDVDWGQLGKDLVAGFKNGISRSWSSLKKWFKNLFGDLIGVAKKILGIASPSKVFKKIGGFTAEGFGAGFEDEFAHVKDDMEDALNFDDASVGINASIRKVGAGYADSAFGGTSIGNITINIDGAKYSDEQSLATAVAEAIQNMTDRRAAVYA